MADVTPTQPFADPMSASLLQMLQAPMSADGSSQAQPMPAAPGTAQPQPGSAPATNPADITAMMTQAGRQGMQQEAQQMGQAGGLSGQVQQLAGQQAAQPIPKMGFLDNQGMQYSGNHPILHNLTQALLAIAAATKPGQAVEKAKYGPGIARYGAEQSARAEQIKTLEGEEKAAGERATTAAGMVSKPITAAGGYERGAAALSKAGAYVAQIVPAQVRTMLGTLDLKRAALNEKTQNDLAKQLQAKVDEVGRNFREEHRDATMEDVAQVVSGTKENIANEVAARNPSLKEFIYQWAGIGTPQVPQAAQPVQRQTPNAPAKSSTTSRAGAVPKGTLVYDPRGVAHTSDGTHPLPKGWSTKKPGA